MKIQTSNSTITQTCGADKCEIQWIEKENHIFLPNVFRQFHLQQQITNLTKSNKYNSYNISIRLNIINYQPNPSSVCASCKHEKEKSTYINEFLVKNSLSYKIWCLVSYKRCLTLQYVVNQTIDID